MSNLCQAVALTLHLVSAHTDPTQNNINPGAGLQCFLNVHTSIGAGVYYNSQRRVSTYANVTATAPIGAGFRAGATIGGATGYDYGPIAPVAGLVLVAPPVSGWSVGLFAGPKTSRNAGVLHLTLTRGL